MEGSDRVPRNISNCPYNTGDTVSITYKPQQPSIERHELRQTAVAATLLILLHLQADGSGGTYFWLVVVCVRNTMQEMNQADCIIFQDRSDVNTAVSS